MPSNVGLHVDDVPLPPLTVDVDDRQHLQMIAVIMDNLVGLVNPDGEVYTGLSRAAHIVCGGIFRHVLHIIYYMYITQTSLS